MAAEPYYPPARDPHENGHMGASTRYAPSGSLVGRCPLPAGHVPENTYAHDGLGRPEVPDVDGIPRVPAAGR